MPHIASIGIIVLLVLFALYRRIRRTVGYQPLAKRRMTTRMVLFLVVLVLFLVSGYLNPIIYLYDAIGIVIGGAIAIISIRTTSFEQRANGWYYRPHPWIGILLVVLLIGRIGVRAYEVYTLSADKTLTQSTSANNGLDVYAHDPFTTLVLFTLFTYYVVYYIFLIRRERHLSNRSAVSSDNTL